MFFLFAFSAAIIHQFYLGLHDCPAEQTQKKESYGTPDDVAKEVIEPAAAERDTFKTERDTLKTECDALKAEVDRLEKLTGKAAKPPAAGGGGDKKLTADEWLAEGK